MKRSSFFPYTAIPKAFSLALPDQSSTWLYQVCIRNVCGVVRAPLSSLLLDTLTARSPSLLLCEAESPLQLPSGSGHGGWQGQEQAAPVSEPASQGKEHPARSSRHVIRPDLGQPPPGQPLCSASHHSHSKLPASSQRPCDSSPTCPLRNEAAVPGEASPNTVSVHPLQTSSPSARP